MSENQNGLLNGDGKQQVELIVKKDQPQTESETTIDLAEIVRFMASKKKIYAFVLAICFVIGAVVPLIMYQASKASPKAVSLLTLNYEEALLGQAPDGSVLSINEIKSTYVLQKALQTVNLSKEISLSDLESNVSVQGVLTDETKQQLELLSSLESNDSKYYEIASQLELKYGNRYFITLSNSFGKDKTVLPDYELKMLLEAIVDSYDEFFFDKYSDNKLPANTLATIAVDTLDYIDVVNQIADAMDDLDDYCKSKDKVYGGFRSATDGYSFSDLQDLIDTKINVSVDPLYSNIFFNHYTKDSATLITKYGYQVRNAELNLGVIEEGISATKANIENYKNEQLVIMSNDEQQSQSAALTTEYYNGLIISLMNQYTDAAKLSEEIKQYNDIITWYTDAATKTADSTTASEINDLYSDCTELFELVTEHTAELFDTDYYKNSYITSLTTMEEASSLKDNITKVAIGAIVGLVVAFVIWAVDGLIMELKKGSKERHPAED